MYKIVYLFLLTTLIITANAAPKKGGTYKMNLGQTPASLNPLSSSDAYASTVYSYILEGLMERDIDTYKWKPALATKWSVDKTGLIFDFTIRKGVTWHDGKPVTIEDVIFSYEAIVEPSNKYKTARLKPYFENFSSAKKVGGNIVRFTAKKKLFANLNTLGGLSIIPKHLYEDITKFKKRKLNKRVVGSGPYVFTKFKRGKSIILTRNKKWWGNKLPENKKRYNFNKVMMRFVKDRTIALQRIEKGDLDFTSLSPEEYEKKTSSKKWGKSVYKVKMRNKSPGQYGFIGWNLEKDLFKSKKIRLALYHLLNRKLMIEKFRYNHSVLATGPLDLQSPYANKSIKPVGFSVKKALKLFAEEGWTDSDGDTFLDKVINGKKRKLSITILNPSKTFMKYLTIYKEDARKAGVEVNVRYIEWNAFSKKLDEKTFDAVVMAWSGGAIDWDPKQIWHSNSRNGGSNYVGYSNAEVDKLIDQARETLDNKARIKMLHKVYKIIADDVPYAFLFNAKSNFYGHTKRMKREKDTYNYGIGTDHWWISKE